MAQVDTRWMIEKYKSDLGLEYEKVLFKIQNNAPKIANIPGVKQRTKALCSGGGMLFSMRYLRVTFNNGRKLQYPVYEPGKVKAVLDEIAEYACADLVGESWSFIPASLIKGTYKTTAYTDIPVRSEKETGSFKYQSDVAGDLTMGYAVEKPGNASLFECQKKGMEEISEVAICGGASKLVKPRHFIIEATSTSGGKEAKVARKSKVSDLSKVSIVGKDISECAFCLKYQGESVNNVHLLF